MVHNNHVFPIRAGIYQMGSPGGDDNFSHFFYPTGKAGCEHGQRVPIDRVCLTTAKSYGKAKPARQPSTQSDQIQTPPSNMIDAPNLSNRFRLLLRCYLFAIRYIDPAIDSILSRCCLPANGRPPVIHRDYLVACPPPRFGLYLSGSAFHSCNTGAFNQELRDHYGSGSRSHRRYP
jgi:hypothetical protein